MGLLAGACQAADVVFVGGTLAPRGGHDVIAAATSGRAIVVGPHVAHVRRIVESLDAAGGIVRIATIGGLLPALAALLEAPARRAHLGQQAAAFCGAHRGAAERAAALILGASGAARSPR